LEGATSLPNGPGKNESEFDSTSWGRPQEGYAARMEGNFDMLRGKSLYRKGPSDCLREDNV
jgi:hypothetical protein